MKRVITPSDAFGAYERAFRAGNPRAVEELLREMLNVQVAVVQDVESAQKELATGKRLKTVSVPYGVFLEKSKGKKIYRLDPSTERKGQYRITPISYEDYEYIGPNQTYILLADEAGYNVECGLTFEGSGVETGWEDQTEPEVREKTTGGCFQKWEEHARGVWERSGRITGLYRSFIERWAAKVLELSNQKLTEFVDSIIWAMRIALYFHDIGKLNKQWQKVVWANEQKIRGRMRDGYIARTSQINDASKRDELENPPFHAPFAYPFLRKLLREILGEYRFLDIIALAAARHHSLEVSGAVRRGEFQWDCWNGTPADKWVLNEARSVLGISNHDSDENERFKKALAAAADSITHNSEADEPPGPTDDFYFLYCLTQRLVKICDWEDAGSIEIELKN